MRQGIAPELAGSPGRSGLRSCNLPTVRVVSGIGIKTHANPLVESNKIHHGLAMGLMCNENGEGNIRNNEFYCNRLCAGAVCRMLPSERRGFRFIDKTCPPRPKNVFSHYPLHWGLRGDVAWQRFSTTSAVLRPGAAAERCAPGRRQDACPWSSGWAMFSGAVAGRAQGLLRRAVLWGTGRAACASAAAGRHAQGQRLGTVLWDAVPLSTSRGSCVWVAAVVHAVALQKHSRCP